MKRKIISIIVVINIIFVLAENFVVVSKAESVQQSISTDIQNIDESKYPGIKSKIKVIKINVRVTEIYAWYSESEIMQVNIDRIFIFLLLLLSKATVNVAIKSENKYESLQ